MTKSSVYSKTYREKNKEKIAAYQLANAERRSNWAQIRNQSYKIRCIDHKGKVCACCGLEYDGDIASIFDFHHRDPEQKRFSVGGQMKSWDDTVIELDKCDMLCANCHRREHSCAY